MIDQPGSIKSATLSNSLQNPVFGSTMLLYLFLLVGFVTVSKAIVADDSTLTITFVGDIMLDGGPGHLLANGHDPFLHCTEILSRSDLTIGNLECVLGKGGEQLNKAYIFRAATDSPQYLKKHFDALSLANNHSYDFGPDGLKEMIRILKDNHIPFFGAGANLAEARSPLIFETKGRRIGLLGYNEFRAENYAATDSQFGNAPALEEAVLLDIRKARDIHRCDIVIPFLHWGEEFESEPRPDQQVFAKRMVEAGAAAVIGTHPHVTQTIEVHRDAPIVYSLGNFVFDYFPVDPPKWYGWIVDFEIQQGKPIRLHKHVVELDPVGVPHLVEAASIE
jgi:poly-gamma-glutamate capsule biosynthesis protein CapA/YwtB (metallophosphatase superfamily)